MIGLAKGGLGNTLVILATPLMSLVMPANQVIGLLLPILIIGDIFAVSWHWLHWDLKLVWLLIPGATVGTIMASFFVTSISPDMLRRGIGAIALSFVIYKLLEQRILNTNYTPLGWHSFVVGGVGGLTSTLAHTGGPPIIIYLLMQNISPRAFVATSALFFACLNWIKLPSYLYLGLLDLNQLWQIAWFLPIMPLSVWFGKILATKIDKVVFDWLVVGLLGIIGVFLVFS